MNILHRSLAALALCSAPALAQTVHLNEIFVSHTGTDDREMVELIGTPNLDLTGYVLLVVEGDSSGAGTCDRVFDLTGSTIPADGFFVIGNDNVPTVDLMVGASNIFENGTETFYLVQTTDVNALLGLRGTNVDSDGDLITDIVGLSTLVDIIAMVDGGFPATDKVYDGAMTIGSGASFLPAGIFRGGDYPNPWCTGITLDFDDVTNSDAVRTPGAPNTACSDAVVSAIGNSCLTGAGTVGGPDITATLPIVGEDFVVTVANAPTGAVGFVYAGLEGLPTPFLGCEIYLNTVAIFNVGAVTFTGGMGTYTLPLPAAASLAGIDFALQAAVATPSTLHLTNGLTGTIGYDQ